MFKQDPNKACDHCADWKDLEAQIGRTPRLNLVHGVLQWTLWLGLPIFLASGIYPPTLTWLANLPLEGMTVLGILGLAALTCASVLLWRTREQRFYIGLTDDGKLHLHLHPNIPVAVSHLLVLPFGLRRRGEAHGTCLYLWSVRTSSKYVWFQDTYGNKLGIRITDMANHDFVRNLLQILSSLPEHIGLILMEAGKYRNRDSGIAGQVGT